MQSTWNAFSGATGAIIDSTRPASPPKHRIRPFALAASVALVVGLAAWIALRNSESLTLETSVGEQRRIALADGSDLDLAPDSRVNTHFTLARREVQLERGQVFFTVAHNALRPFIVHVNGLTVTAVGTAFDVRMGPGSTVVTVSEGRINVAPAAADDGPSAISAAVRASIGQRVTFSKSARRLSVATVDPKVAGSWREGKLQFVGEPLEDVVGAVNRYSASPIVVAPAFQQIRFTGTVSPTNVRDWLKALEQIYAVDVVDQGAQGTLIRARANDDVQR